MFSNANCEGSLRPQLASGVPLTLLCDLVSTAAPASRAINSAERPADDMIWLEKAETYAAQFRAASA